MKMAGCAPLTTEEIEEQGIVYGQTNGRISHFLSASVDVTFLLFSGFPGISPPHILISLEKTFMK